jgi:hypothetical protein
VREIFIGFVTGSVLFAIGALVGHVHGYETGAADWRSKYCVVADNFNVLSVVHQAERGQNYGKFSVRDCTQIITSVDSCDLKDCEARK